VGPPFRAVGAVRTRRGCLPKAAADLIDGADGTTAGRARNGRKERSKRGLIRRP
jgi:hypothetical protein